MSQSSEDRPLTVDDLVRYFRDAETPPEDWRIGTEHEKIGIYSDGRGRVPHEGEAGIGAVLGRIAELDAWQPVREGSNLIALYKDGATITLEPGGQLELSGAPLRGIHETCSEFDAHVDLVKRASEDLGIAWLALGSDPFHDVGAIPTMPKERYAIMRSYLPTRGHLALHMMHGTATVQANLDYRDEPDMVAKLRLAMGCSPIVSAIFANSCLAGGKRSGFASRRLEIWQHTDPDRCGILHFVFEPAFGYREYAEWALDVPMFFVVRDHAYLPAKGLTFRQFMARGFAEERATLDDWDLHLTTLFPEVRLKRFIEMRGADAVPGPLLCALPALWKGLLYDAGALEAAWELVRGWGREEREEALGEVARRGLAARTGGKPVLDLARELAQISSEGLRRIAERGESDRDERSILGPLHEQVELGRSPAEILLERWEGPWQRRPERLIEYARY
ncbi:MAG: glutamate--cysteine ligase [Proteobacteria bacterium]|nr:glutamate--cysteine ligase [Pseudomonadota bacterium]